MKKLYLTALLGTAIAMPYMAQAAIDGTLGATSSGSIGIDMTVTPEPASEIQITGLNDMSFGNLAYDSQFGVPTKRIRLDNICVYANQALGYSLEFTSANNPISDGHGILKSSEGADLGYNLSFNDGHGHLNGGNISSGFVPNSDVDCSVDGADAYILLTIRPDQFLTVNEDIVYTDTITLTVSPE